MTYVASVPALCAGADGRSRKDEIGAELGAEGGLALAVVPEGHLNLLEDDGVGSVLQPPTPSRHDAPRPFRLGHLPRVWHAGHVNVRPAPGWPDEADQGDVVGEGQVVELGMDDDVRHVQLLVRQGFRRDGHVVLPESDLQDAADVPSVG